MSNEAAIWWPFHTKDMRSETCNMSKVAKCCYIELLDLLWEHDGSIPADDAWICGELGMTRKAWAAVKDRVLRQFNLSNGRLSHPRMAIELVKAKANIDQKRRAGRASAEARKANGRSTGVATDVERANQPYAGGGNSYVGDSNQSQEEEARSVSHTHTRGLTVIGGGK